LEGGEDRVAISSAVAGSGEPVLGSVGVNEAAKGFILLFRREMPSSESIVQAQSIYVYLKDIATVNGKENK
jgi:hypothetical protein